MTFLQVVVLEIIEAHTALFYVLFHLIISSSEHYIITASELGMLRLSLTQWNQILPIQTLKPCDFALALILDINIKCETKLNKFSQLIYTS